MFNPRLLLQIPLLLLGSCTPVMPSTSIIVIANGDRHPEVSTQDERLKPRLERLMEKECKQLELAEVKAYSMPPLPDVSKLDPEDKEALVDALFDNIKMLRKEITDLKEKFQCNLEHAPKV